MSEGNGQESGPKEGANEKRPRGRPITLQPGEHRTSVIKYYCSAAEHETLRKLAAQQQITLSALLRQALEWYIADTESE